MDGTKSNQKNKQQQQKDVLGNNIFFFLAVLLLLTCWKSLFLLANKQAQSLVQIFFYSHSSLHPPSLSQAESTTVLLKAYAFDLCANK